MVECYGNALENCAKIYYKDRDFWDWIVCVEENIEDVGDFDTVAEDCAEKFSLNYDDIHYCAWKPEGNEAVHESAQVT